MTKKAKYTKLFLQFWETYPRKTAKGPAFTAWQKQVDEEDAFMAKAVIDDLAKRTRLKWWPFDKTKIPHPATWLNARRWEDEGWQDDIKTRDKEEGDRAYTYQPRIEDDYGLDNWQMMCNRLMRSFLLVAGGVADDVLQKLIAIKNAAYAELKESMREEIDAAEDKTKARGEMAHLLADLMLRRFDIETGKSIRHKVIETSTRSRA